MSVRKERRKVTQRILAVMPKESPIDLEEHARRIAKVVAKTKARR